MLPDFFVANLQKAAKGKDSDNKGIAGTQGNNFSVVSEGRYKRMGEEKAKDAEYQIAEGHKHNAMAGGVIGFFKVMFPQLAGDEGVEAHTGAYRNSYHKGLNGKCQRNGSKGMFPQAGYKDAVHNVVHSLNKHGEHSGKRHRKEQLPNGHNAHFIFSFFVQYTHNFLYQILGRYHPQSSRQFSARNNTV